MRGTECLDAKYINNTATYENGMMKDYPSKHSHRSVGYFIRAGVLNLRKLGSVERNILQTIEHPDYSAPQVYYDVAIIVLDEVQCQHSVDTNYSYLFAFKGFRIQ